MKNLLKGTLGVVAATVALAVLTSAAIAAAPALSPVPPECTGECVTHEGGHFGAGGGGAFSRWSGALGNETGTGVSAPEGASFKAWNEGTEVNGLKVTFKNNNICKNEGNNFTSAPLKGRLGVVEGKDVVLLEPETGSTIGKCSDSGASVELTGSVIAELQNGSKEGEVTLTFAGEHLQRLMPLEPAHVLMASIEGGKASALYWEGPTSMQASWTTFHEPKPKLHTSGLTATLATPSYAGGFQLSGGTMTFQAKSGLKITCKYTSGEGRFTSATGGTVSVSWSSCKGPLGCIPTGWEHLKMKVQLAYTYPATETAEGRQTAVVLSPESEIINKTVCGGIEFTNKGAVMGVISPLAKSTSTFALVLKQTNGKEEHTEYEGASGGAFTAILLEQIEAGKFEEAGLEVTTPSIYLNAGGVETLK